MSLFPDKGFDQREEEVLQRAPFLRTFLDSTAMKLDYIQWSSDLKNHGDRVLENMATHLGNNWEALTIAPLLINGELFKVLNPEIPTELKFALVKGIVTVGFEVGNRDDIKLVLINVVKKIGEDQSLNPLCLTSEPDRFKAVDYIRTLLYTGAYLKRLTLLDKNTINPPRSPFRDFINGLDIEGF